MRACIHTEFTGIVSPGEKHLEDALSQWAGHSHALSVTLGVWKRPTCIQMAGGTHGKRNPKAGKIDKGHLHGDQRKSVDPEGRDQSVPGGAEGPLMGKLEATFLADSGKQRPRALLGRHVRAFCLPNNRRCLSTFLFFRWINQGKES